LVWIPHISLNNQGFSAHRTNFFGHSIQGARKLWMGVDGLAGKRDVPAFPGHRSCYGGTHATTSACNENNLIVKSHGTPSGGLVNGNNRFVRPPWK
jgi:hypothetical protein